MGVLPQLVARGAPDLARAPAEAFGSGAGELALARQTRDAAESIGAIYEAEQQGLQAAALAATAAELDEAERVSIQQQDHEAWEPSFEAARASITERHVKGLRGDYALEYQSRADELGIRFRSQLRDKIQAKRIDVARGSRLEAYSALMARAKDADSDVVRAALVGEADRILERRVEYSGPDGKILSFEVFDAEERARLRVQHDESIRDADRRRSSEAIAAEIAAQEPDAARRLALARERIGGDTALLDATIARLKDRNAEEKAARDEARDRRMDGLVARAYDGTLGHSELSHLGPTLQKDERAALESILDREDRQQTADKTTYFRLRRILSDPSLRQQARGIDLWAAAGDLTREELKELQTLQAAPNAQQARIDRLRERQIRAYLQKGRQRRPKEEQRAIAYRVATDAAIRRAQERLGRYQLSDEEIDDVLRGQLREVVDSDWWESRYRLFELDPETRRKIDVPPADADRIRRRLEELGVPAPTADEVLEAYLDETYEPPAEDLE